MVIRVQEENGDYTNVNTMEMTVDADGNYGPYGNNPRGLYTVQVKKGEAYKDTIEAKIESNITLMSAVGSDTGAGQILAYENMGLLNKDSNPMIEVISRYAPLDIIIASGFPYESQNDEEAQYIEMKKQQMAQQAQQQQDPMMVAAQAEAMKAPADQAKVQIDIYNAESKRLDTNIKAMSAQVDAQLRQEDMRLRAWEKQVESMNRPMQ
jgi:hypothetical protein